MKRLIMLVVVFVLVLSAFSVASQEEPRATLNEPIPACTEDEMAVIAEIVPEYVRKFNDIVERAVVVPAQEWWDFSDRVDVILGEMNGLRLTWRFVVDDLPRCAYAVELFQAGTLLFSELELEMWKAQAGLGLWHRSDINGIEELTEQFLAFADRITT